MNKFILVFFLAFALNIFQCQQQTNNDTMISKDDLKTMVQQIMQQLSQERMEEVKKLMAIANKSDNKNATQANNNATQAGLYGYPGLGLGYPFLDPFFNYLPLSPLLVGGYPYGGYPYGGLNYHGLYGGLY